MSHSGQYTIQDERLHARACYLPPLRLENATESERQAVAEERCALHPVHLHVEVVGGVEGAWEGRAFTLGLYCLVLLAYACAEERRAFDPAYLRAEVGGGWRVENLQMWMVL